MAEVVYTTVPGKIPSLLAKIKSNGVPKKADTVWLKAIGFTSSNDKSLLPVLRNIYFIDASKTPTETWRKFRGGGGDVILGEAIRQGYQDLYDIYEDAHEQSSSDIANVFKTKSSAGDQAISKAVSTFKALVAEAKFLDVMRSTQETRPPEPLESVVAHMPPAQPKSGARSHSPSLHIDLQVHISPESSAEQIDKIFASMAKHLYRKDE